VDQFRQYAKQWHPDTSSHPKANEVFAHVNNLYAQARDLWGRPEDAATNAGAGPGPGTGAANSAAEASAGTTVTEPAGTTETGTADIDQAEGGSEQDQPRPQSKTQFDRFKEMAAAGVEGATAAYKAIMATINNELPKFASKAERLNHARLLAGMEAALVAVKPTPLNGLEYVQAFKEALRAGIDKGEWRSKQEAAEIAPADHVADQSGDSAEKAAGSTMTDVQPDKPITESATANRSGANATSAAASRRAAKKTTRRRKQPGDKRGRR
jgi:hypothetical protein